MCGFGDFGCYFSGATGAVASKVTNSFLDEVRKSAADATTTILKTLGTHDDALCHNPLTQLTATRRYRY